jgi:hypothetical protein
MAYKPVTKSPQRKSRSIIGISLSPALASKVKAEAGRRQIRLKQLFEEMWALYEKRINQDRS